MTEKAKIAIIGEDNTINIVEVPVIYKTGNVVVHKTFWSNGGPTRYNPSNVVCGFNYVRGGVFRTVDAAIEFANYLSSIPELNNIQKPEDTKNISPEITRKMYEKQREILKRDF